MPAGLLLLVHQLSQVGNGVLHHSLAAEHGELGAGVGRHVSRALEDWKTVHGGAGRVSGRWAAGRTSCGRSQHEHGNKRVSTDVVTATKLTKQNCYCDQFPRYEQSLLTLKGYASENLSKQNISQRPNFHLLKHVIRDGMRHGDELRCKNGTNNTKWYVIIYNLTQISSRFVMWALSTSGAAPATRCLLLSRLCTLKMEKPSQARPIIGLTSPEPGASAGNWIVRDSWVTSIGDESRPARRQDKG